MNYYVYALPNGALSPRGISEGLNGFITDEHYRFKEYQSAGGAYLFIGDYNKPGTVEDVFISRAYSCAFKPQVQILKRICVTRTGWSRR